jgi:hypothetical protein
VKPSAAKNNKIPLSSPSVTGGDTAAHSLGDQSTIGDANVAWYCVKSHYLGKLPFFMLCVLG